LSAYCYRLNVVRLHLSPLRERREDIPLLIEHFYRQFTDGGTPPEELVKAMMHHDWPGNVRELRGAVERGDPRRYEPGAGRARFSKIEARFIRVTFVWISLRPEGLSCDESPLR
jgi:transcriptional regulator with GAF, ATPase, and Fis domain